MITSYIRYYNTRRVQTNTDGKAQVVPCCIKSGWQHLGCQLGQLYYFTVLLAGSSFRAIQCNNIIINDDALISYIYSKFCKLILTIGIF